LEDADDDSRDVGVEMGELAENSGLLATCETLVDPSGTPTLKLIGELDIASVAPIGSAIDAIVADRPARVAVDLSELRFIDSSGLSLFLSMADQVAEVELRNPSAIVRKVLSLTGLSSVFVVTP
jgi:anti-sigma B factor antagonist